MSDASPNLDLTSPRIDADKPLRRDVRTLGFELGRVLKRHGSEGLYELVEEVRALSKARRAGDDEADIALRERIAAATPEELGNLIRALSCFFDLANLAEDRHRIRVLREREAAMHPAPRSESIGAAIESLATSGATSDDVRSLLSSLDIELVFTAHPTEAKRRTIRSALRRLRDDLILLDRGHSSLLPRERERLLTRIKTDLDCLWETDTLRPRKPTVLEEVDRSLFVAEPLWEVVPHLYRGMRQALARHYPELADQVPRFLRFGSWIGGDRDGNPFVTADVTRQTLIVLRHKALDKHRQQCKALTAVLSISARRQPISQEMEAAITDAAARWPACAQAIQALNPHEKYRHWLAVIRYRLKQTRKADPFEPVPEGAYTGADELITDLQIMVRSLEHTGHQMLAQGQLRDWIEQTRVFGFHFARLDMREDASRLQEAIAQLHAAMGLPGQYAAADEAGKQAVLTQPLDPQAARRLADLLEHQTEENGTEAPEGSLPEPAQSTLELFVLLHRVSTTFGAEALGTIVVSMTHHPSDVLAVLWLSRLGALVCGDQKPAAALPLVPLFETIDDLERAATILADLLDQPDYAAHVQACGNIQVCMVGYSDSTKDGGYLAANWSLYRAEKALAEVTRQRGIELTIFHGRGGALGRGGGPAARGILSLPPHCVRGRIRITEQGEVLAERYDDPEIAYRHLEQVTWATLLVSSQGTEPVSPQWKAMLDRATQSSLKAYRRLIEDPSFIAYFREATPIASIETLPIGSRPARRQTQPVGLDSLRAIPYVFAWTQNRHLVPAFFGLGTGLQSAAEGDWRPFQDMYGNWPFFRAVIDNAELALAKCDMAIGRAYAALLDDADAGQRLWTVIRDEYEVSRRAVLHITGRDELLDATPWLQRSIRVRNPYVDPLNFIQVELMRRLPDDAPQMDPLRELLRLSVQGVAAGLRTTG